MVGTRGRGNARAWECRFHRYLCVAMTGVIDCTTFRAFKITWLHSFLSLNFSATESSDSTVAALTLKSQICCWKLIILSDFLITRTWPVVHTARTRPCTRADTARMRLCRRPVRCILTLSHDFYPKIRRRLEWKISAATWKWNDLTDFERPSRLNVGDSQVYLHPTCYCYLLSVDTANSVCDSTSKVVIRSKSLWIIRMNASSSETIHCISHWYHRPRRVSHWIPSLILLFQGDGGTKLLPAHHSDYSHCCKQKHPMAAICACNVTVALTALHCS